MKDVPGYQRFAVAGGDVGSPISQFLAFAHPESVVDLHVTDIGFYFLNAGQSDLFEDEGKYLGAIQPLHQGAAVGYCGSLVVRRM